MIIGYVNNICFGKDLFMKYWDAGQPAIYEFPPEHPHYSFYGIHNLAFGYFISNLIEDVHIQLNGENIPKTMNKYLYPINDPYGKEGKRIPEYEVEFFTIE